MSREYLIPWIKPRKLEWEQRARQFQSYMFFLFGGIQYQSYKKNEYHVLDTDIYFALYVLPNNISTWGSNGNKADNVANKIGKTIVHVYKRYSRASTLRIGFIFLYCKGTYKEFHLTIFRVYTSDKDDECFYVDTHCRIYDSWLSWKNDNKLPMLKYCYPLNGFYTCSNDHEDISDRKREPILEFGSSPACKLVARLGRMLDVGSEIARYNNMFFGLTSLFIFLDSIKTMFAGVVGVAGAVYGAARSVQCLVDKKRHETSLLDAESLMHGLNILMILPHVIMAVVNTPLSLRYLSQAISPRDILTTGAQKILSLTFTQRLGLIVLTLVLHQQISEYLNTTHSNANKHIDKIKTFNLRAL
ncbi:uncharacterized protein LOC128886879 isoform X2 [Hylaeus anthracinus]|uniref:uncharacterized protein LOC128886879 isoform X2 n=1 Tax=Hylaeus anthracinus TaxID=313031 RepID=UPI0023BA2480|nr:uncharacterized protein LOC128886879 isoform X2 [Hylaeus anthracinus]XP_053998070.1 uncharacterized protein LOC128886879 isoform X2 [Hylaeus anthracinus]XP_053998071.1 uncharacterized protein LOC128886879 isoform X2 [Hylaeus anthracinus]XP_053998072.1 uncharacterized protein LOC128886879 isoform X2 [Hylaeus anthracinus]